MKKAALMLFPLIASFALAGIVFYYLIMMPLSGGYNVTVRTSGLKPVYSVGAPVTFNGIIANAGKNASEFYIDSGIISDGTDNILRKSYFLAAGGSRHFSFGFAADKSREGKKTLLVSVSRPSKLPGFKDAVIWSRQTELVFAPLRDTKPASPEVKSKPSPAPLAAPPPKYAEEIVRAQFSATFPETVRYGEVSKLTVRLKNLTSTPEVFDVFLQITPPSGTETLSTSRVALRPSETKQVDFLYKVMPGHSEGNYSAKIWYRTRQAVSEEIYAGAFKLSDEEPVIQVKKMLMDPVSGKPAEILVEASDDIGVREVIFISAAQSPTGARSDSRNIPMYLFSGDERRGIWRCEYIPKKSDAYVFSFLAVDTKRQRSRLGEFPVKVIK
ncbi:MAG: hypothetical protein CVU77_08060 [Elusimicrobia bacterium HGW-Elusimicrobia-1]|jgi:hypothetical protein|nr:MAG: hypothetical protein CVU77_08060 [Elusimicrobia bacterium HGW-Elusimicrobia-1]